MVLVGEEVLGVASLDDASAGWELGAVAKEVLLSWLVDCEGVMSAEDWVDPKAEELDALAVTE